MKKAEEDMKVIFKNTKNTSIDVWEYDYVSQFA